MTRVFFSPSLQKTFTTKNDARTLSEVNAIYGVVDFQENIMLDTEGSSIKNSVFTKVLVPTKAEIAQITADAILIETKIRNNAIDALVLDGKLTPQDATKYKG